MSLPMLQVALDNQTMDSAYETTRLIAEEVDIIEVGTILCVGEGVRAVRDLNDAPRDKCAHFREINGIAAAFQHLQKNYIPAALSFL